MLVKIHLFFFTSKMANIFYDSNYASQTSMPSDAVFNSMTSDNIIIPASTPGDVLFIGPQKQIDGLAIGPNKYVLESNGSQPAWTNALDINSIKATQYTIPGTFHGDLFTVNAFNNLERVPIGGAGNILTSTGTEYAWQPLDLPNPLSIQNLTLTNGTLTLANSVISDPNKQFAIVDGVGGNISPAGAPVASANFNIVAGRLYKLHIWGKIINANPVSLTYYVNGALVNDTTYFASGGVSFVHLFVGASTGLMPVVINGVASSGSASLLTIWFTIESW